MSTGALVVVKPGLLTTVQDLGRFGHQASGVPVAGPMDAFSHRLANQLVGNDPGAATLEITLIGPELMVEADTTMAITGAHFDVACDERSVPTGASFGVRAGSRLKFGRIHQGARAYLAVAGGVQTPPVLGSRATHLVSRMGGLAGRALVAGDRIPIATGARAAAAPEVRGPDAAVTRTGAAARVARTAGSLVRARRAEDDGQCELSHLAALEPHGLSPRRSAAAARARTAN